MIEDDPTHIVFTDETRQQFLDDLYKSHYHITPEEKENIRSWLTDTTREPQSISEYNRRNYILKTFQLDEATGRIYAQGQKVKKNRLLKVKTTDQIVDVVERCHRRVNHGGRPKTWRKIKKRYHGVLWPDVVYLLRRCEMCKEKYPRRYTAPETRRKDRQ